MLLKVSLVRQWRVALQFCGYGFNTLNDHFFVRIAKSRMYQHGTDSDDVERLPP